MGTGLHGGGGRKRGLPDLHRHLDGSLRMATVEEMAARLSLQVPQNLAFKPGMGMDEALAKFAFTLSLLQTPGAVRRVASEICEDAASDGVTTLEIRFAPQLHKGGCVEATVDAALDGADGRAGLVLCGLYGEPPEVLEGLVRVASGRPGVVGVDIACAPLPEHSFGLADYAPAFLRAEDMGLGRTVHAGEGRPAAEIRAAVELLHANRIGHGLSLLDDPGVRDLVIERGVTIEACPTSNFHTGIIPSISAHPLPLWLDAGVRACVCPDNTLLSGVTASEEHARAAAIPGMTPAKMAAVIAHGHAEAFRR